MVTNNLYVTTQLYGSEEVITVSETTGETGTGNVKNYKAIRGAVKTGMDEGAEQTTGMVTDNAPTLFYLTIVFVLVVIGVKLLKDFKKAH